jgi:hypothetical protein
MAVVMTGHIMTVMLIFFCTIVAGSNKQSCNGRSHKKNLFHVCDLLNEEINDKRGNGAARKAEKDGIHCCQ